VIVSDTEAIEVDFEIEEAFAIDVKTVSGGERAQEKADWLGIERDRLKISAEEITGPLVETNKRARTADRRSTATIAAASRFKEDG
jgi:hypothetical protein